MQHAPLRVANHISSFVPDDRIPAFHENNQLTSCENRIPNKVFANLSSAYPDFISRNYCAAQKMGRARSATAHLPGREMRRDVVWIEVSQRFIVSADGIADSVWSHGHADIGLSRHRFTVTEWEIVGADRDIPPATRGWWTKCLDQCAKRTEVILQRGNNCAERKSVVWFANQGHRPTLLVRIIPMSRVGRSSDARFSTMYF